MTESRRRGNVIAKVVAIVGAIGQVERLCEQLQVHAIAELDILREPRVELKERVAAQRIILRNRASLRNSVQPVEAVLRPCGKIGRASCRKEVRWRWSQ